MVNLMNWWDFDWAVLRVYKRVDELRRGRIVSMNHLRLIIWTHLRLGTHLNLLWDGRLWMWGIKLRHWRDHLVWMIFVRIL